MMPICRAQRLDNDEYIEGFYSQGVSRHPETRFATTHIINIKEIDPSTLAISFDNGDTWFDMENADRAFREYSKTHGYEGEPK